MPKALHISIIVVIIVAILFTAVMLILRYDEKGEINMPFEISKISIISTVDVQDVQDDKNIWNKSVGENNDVYIYVNKNNNYKKTEVIEKIILNNFQINKISKKGNSYIYIPSNSEKEIFENKDKYKVNEITFSGAQSTNMKKMQISNQGGIIQFRISNENLGKFISNGDKILEYKNLLKKINVAEEDMNLNVSFDVALILADGMQFKANVSFDVSSENVIDMGKSSKELTDLDIAFKRVI